jgi:hypothetical protein
VELSWAVTVPMTTAPIVTLATLNTNAPVSGRFFMRFILRRKETKSNAA